jgi:hypothetical protein
LSSKKLIVYGDSYAEEVLQNPISWTSQLATKLNLTMLNRATSGSSIEYSIKYFIEDKLSNIISSDDIIIFIFTALGRLHLKYQIKHPRTASAFAAGRFGINYFPNYISYYKQYEKYINWFQKNKDENIFKINASSYFHMLNNYARSNPNNTFIILSVDTLLHPIDIPLLDNFLIPNINLRKISNNEFSSGIDFQSFIRHLTIDVRHNHLTIPNSAILAELLYKVIINNDPTILTYDKFLQNILDINIKSKKDYLHYIEKEIVYFMPKIMDSLK